MNSIFSSFYLFPIYFVLFWAFISFIISKSGWSALASEYKTEEKFIGTNIGIISASINNASYRNGLILKYNKEGIYLKAVFIFRLFHPPIFIPWKDISDVRDEKLLF